ncbi:MAG: DNA polymerase IV [Clostridia bacterium]|nr:DNA polymerase IV [Clostridia bacterium]
MERTILHCDMNNFYASCECALDPSLYGKPIAVCGSQEERHGIVLAKSESAKACGVKTGEAIWQAKQKCPGLLVVPPHYDLYLQYSKLAREIYAEYTDLIEPMGLDEVWLDVTGSRLLFGDGMTIAETLRQRIKQELGLTISVGVSFNKIFAKLGSDMKKPDAITHIPRERFREITRPLPVGELFGVGRATEKALAAFGVDTIGRLADTPLSVLEYKFGKNGRTLWQNANGEDHTPVAPMDAALPMKSAGHGTTTSRDLENEAEVWRVMLQLTQDLGHRLRLYGKQAWGVSVSIRDANLSWKQWQEKLSFPTQNAGKLAEVAFALFRRGYRWHLPVRSVTVTAIDLKEQDAPLQMDLFTDTVALERQERLDVCVESIRNRFGATAIHPAILCGDLPTGDGVEKGDDNAWAIMNRMKHDYSS